MLRTTLRVRSGSGSAEEISSQAAEIEKEIERELLQCLREAEPKKYPLEGDGDGQTDLPIRTCIERFVQHHADITGIFLAMYDDVAFKKTKVFAQFYTLLLPALTYPATRPRWT